MQLYAVTIAFSLFFIFFVIELVRRGALREQYSLLWLGVGLVMLVFSASSRLLQWVAHAFGVYYAPSLLFLFGLICAFVLLLHVTVVISRLTDRVIRLTQELGITQMRLAELEHRVHAAVRQPPRDAGDLVPPAAAGTHAREPGVCGQAAASDGGARRAGGDNP
ncbi:MAG: DUF2304 domain-containing protein [Alicyclobacillaceae bacterium]|nr:DUF2304 domain-containing protein [Alicyclobacillaceae bacterium]